MILILFGPPGSGKGTQAQYLVDNMNFQHISTGDLLRNEIKQNTDLGNQVKGIMDAGLYVPDDIIIKIVDNIIAKEPEKNYIFDGFPRTLNQALAMEQLLGVRHLKVDLVIDFSVNLEELVQRISGRFSCAACGTVYHDKCTFLGVVITNYLSFFLINLKLQVSVINVRQPALFAAKMMTKQWLSVALRYI